MSNSNRGGDVVLTLAAVGALIALSVCAAGIVLNEYAKVHQGYASYQRNAADDRREAAEKAAQACKDTEVAALSLCVADQIEAYAREQSTNQDLQAQQDMAFWAMWMFVTSGVTILVTGVGVYLVWQTLEATREAVSDTRTATEAMLRQNELTEYAQRPWVIVDDIKIDSGGIINIHFKNVGHSPARSFVKIAEAAVARAPFRPSPVPELEIDNYTFLPPNAVEMMRLAVPGKAPPIDFEVLVRIRLSYVLPSGERDEHFEAFAITAFGKVRKATPHDFRQQDEPSKGTPD